jgi:hypothetical protein
MINKIVIVFFICLISATCFADVKIIYDQEKIDYYNHLFEWFTANDTYGRLSHQQDFIVKHKGAKINKKGKLEFIDKNRREEFFAFVEEYYNSETDFSVYMVTYMRYYIYNKFICEKALFVYHIGINSYNRVFIEILMPDHEGIGEICYYIDSYFRSTFLFLPDIDTSIGTNINFIGIRQEKIAFLEEFNKRYVNIKKVRVSGALNKKDTPLKIKRNNDITIINANDKERMEKYTKMFVNFLDNGKRFKIGNNKGITIPEAIKGDTETFYVFLEDFYLDDKNFSIYLITSSENGSFNYYQLYANEYNKEFSQVYSPNNRTAIDGLFEAIHDVSTMRPPEGEKKRLDIKKLYKYNKAKARDKMIVKNPLKKCIATFVNLFLAGLINIIALIK